MKALERELGNNQSLESVALLPCQFSSSSLSWVFAVKIALGAMG